MPDFLKKFNRNTTPNFRFLKNCGYCAAKVATTISRLSFALTLYVQIGCRKYKKNASSLLICHFK